MIVWNGRGYIIPLIMVLGGVISGRVLPIEQTDLGIALVFFSTGIFGWVEGKKWNGEEPKHYLDQAAGKQVIVKPDHSLFWIKMEY